MLAEIATDGSLTAATRRRLARTAFAHTAGYDAAIVTWFDESSEEPDAPVLPPSIHLSLELAQPLRYGENPHQQGARYRQSGRTSWWDVMTQHGGKELSYLNVFDTEAAWRLVQTFAEPACVIVKHANPCGVAVADLIADAYTMANACDPVSAFGGIVALNRTVPAELAVALGEVFTEVIVAPGYDADALDALSAQEEPARAVRRCSLAAAVRRAPGRRRVPRPAARRGQPAQRQRGASSPRRNRPTNSGATSSSPGGCARR